MHWCLMFIIILVTRELWDCWQETHTLRKEDTQTLFQKLKASS